MFLFIYSLVLDFFGLSHQANGAVEAGYWILLMMDIGFLAVFLFLMSVGFQRIKAGYRGR